VQSSGCVKNFLLRTVAGPRSCTKKKLEGKLVRIELTARLVFESVTTMNVTFVPSPKKKKKKKKSGPGEPVNWRP
jgi:hypothetical protein